MILNGMIFKDHIIQYMIHFLLPWDSQVGSVLGPRDSISWYTPARTKIKHTSLCCLDAAQGLSSLSYDLCNGHQGFDKGHSMCLAIQSTRPGRSALFRLLSNSEGGAVFIVYFKPLSVNGLNIQSDFWVAYLICLIGSLGCTGVELPKAARTLVETSENTLSGM